MPTDTHRCPRVPTGTHSAPTGCTHLVAVVGPGAELHLAALVVERKVGDVDLAGAAQLGGRRPEHLAGVVDHRAALHEALGEVVGAATARQESAWVRQGCGDAGMRGCGDAGMRGCGDAGMRGCGDAGMRGCGDAGMRGCGDAGMRGCGDAGMRGCGDAGMRGCGDAGMRGCGDAGMRGCGDAGMRGCGDAGMRGCGDAGMRRCWVRRYCD